jgi:predicted dithiol-disulfide oxidoreductase (DUF899 family)
MFGPDWEAGCPHCSFWGDNFDGIIVHLKQRDVTMIARVSGVIAKAGEIQETNGVELQVGLVI